MPNPHEDLFETSKMSFGAHLEELRVCLIRAMLGLIICVGIGLYFGDDLVKFVGSPITKALESYYQSEGEKKYEQWLETYEGTPPWSEEEIKKLTTEEGLLFEIHYIHPDQVSAALHHRYPATFKDKRTVETTKLKENLEKARRKKAKDDEVEYQEPPNTVIPGYTHAEAKGDIPSKSSSQLVPIFLWHKNSDDTRISLKGLAAEEGFMTWLKVGFFAGLTLASPWVFYQLWIFVAAGLYPNEKRYVHLFLPISITLFVAGACLAFFFVFEYVLNFLFTFNQEMGISPEPRVSEWIKFAMILPLGFGISFQLPLVMLFLERIHVFSVEVYISKWRIAVLVIAFVSMILTPADPMSMMLMFVPLTLLFFGGILMCKYLPKSKSPFASEGTELETRN